MGTRAVISINGKLIIATHWDGYPSGLGKDIFKAFTREEIIEAANKRNIDFAIRSIMDQINAPRIKELAKKHNMTEDAIIRGYRKGIVTADDYLVGDIRNYGDFAEYQYDLTDGEWKYRTVNGAWSENPKFGKWKKSLEE